MFRSSVHSLWIVYSCGRRGPAGNLSHCRRNIGQCTEALMRDHGNHVERRGRRLGWRPKDTDGGSTCSGLVEAAGSLSHAVSRTETVAGVEGKHGATQSEITP